MIAMPVAPSPPRLPSASHRPAPEAVRNGQGLPGLALTHTAGKALLVVCYVPLLLWAPTLAVVTYAYYRRRCRD